MVMAWSLVPASLGGLIVGGLLVWLWLRSAHGVLRERLAAAEREVESLAPLRPEVEQLKIQLAELNKERQADAEKLQWVSTAEQQLREAFQALAGQSLQVNATEFLTRANEQLQSTLSRVRDDWEAQRTQMQGIVSPLGESLTRLDTQVQDLERRREGAYRGMEEQLRQLGESHNRLQTTTLTLASALKASSSARGRWGELQLHRIVDMAGMVEHVDFDEQVVTEEGRPDMVIHLPNGGAIPVDSKAPMTAYLEALECTDEAARAVKLSEHSRAFQARIKDLGRKAYWKQFDKAPDFVVMFVPNDACLCAAYERDPNLLESAIAQRVLITTPVTLLALLKSAGYGWQQYQVSESIRQVADQGRELYDRMVTLSEHICKTGEILNQTVDAYNGIVGSVESRVLPAARRFKEAGLGTKELAAPTLVERQARLLEAPGAESAA